MPSGFKENSEDLNTAESVQVDVNPLDVEAIRARLDAATARDVGPDDVDIDAEMDRVRSARLVLDGLAPVDIRDLLDENARLNAENNTLTVQLNNSKMCALRELQAQIRGDEAEAERDALVVKVAVLTEFADSVRRAQPRSNHSELDQGWNACLESIQDGLTPSVLAALPAAPEMPRPPAEEAQERPETVGTGSGRGTGVAEAPGSDQEYAEHELIKAHTHDGDCWICTCGDWSQIAFGPNAVQDLTASHEQHLAEAAPSLPVPSTEEAQ